MVNVVFDICERTDEQTDKYTLVTLLRTAASEVIRRMFE